MSEQVVIYIESVTGTVAEVHARTAVAAVRVSPTKPKGKGRLEATETREALVQLAEHCLQVCLRSANE